MFGCRWDARPEVWSLQNIEWPWGDAQAILDLIASERPLPDEDSEIGIRWAPGALDGVLGHHGRRANQTGDAGRIVDALGALLAQSTASNLRRLYDTVCELQVIEIVDDLLVRLSDASEHRARLAVVGRLFLSRAPRREAVKFGVAVLGLAGNADDVELLLRVGACEEFTLFASVAIQNLSTNPERDLWQLAKSVAGWGRIHTVERLAHTKDAEICHWLLREGFRNGVMDEYLACVCARAGRLHEALRAIPREARLLDSATDLILALLQGGPAENIDDYEHAAEAIEAYLDALWIQTGRHAKEFFLIGRIHDWLSDKDGLDSSSQCGWTPVIRNRCLQQCRELLARDGWREAIYNGLQSPDDTQVYWANQSARRLGIDTWDELFRRVEADPVSSIWWYELTAATDDATRIDRIVGFAENAIPLGSISTGPGDEIGIGVGFEAHRTLDWMLQLLDRYPGKGWTLIRAGLQSPVVRNRNWSLRVFKNWRRQEWPSDAEALLKSITSVEPNEKLREDLAAFVGKNC